jgi:hypothetical protein
MKLKFFAVLALAALSAVNEARASFTYSVAPVNTVTPFGAGSTLTVAAFNGGVASGTLSGIQNINLAQITQTSTTVPPATDTSPGIPVVLTVTINNLNGGGSSNFVVSGNIVITRSDTQGAASTFVLGSIVPAALNLGSFVYTLGATSYAPPTIQAGVSGNGSLSILITETPEPASIALMGIGTAALAGLAIRRRIHQA